jgi:transposase
MEQFVGLDISQDTTHLCVVDGKGKKMWQGKCPTKPEDIAKTIQDKAPAATLIGLESGALSPWLWHALKSLGLPVVCVDARHAHGALGMQINKTDANDAHGIAQMMRTNFFKQVTVKSLDSHRIRTLLGARAQLVGMRTDLKNQVRSVLKTFGFMVSQSVEKGFEAKVRGTLSGQPLLQTRLSRKILLVRKY